MNLKKWVRRGTACRAQDEYSWARHAVPLRIQLLLFFVYIFCFKPVFAEVPEQLLERVEKEQLYNDPEWLLLNHFWQNVIGQTISRIDDPDFFLSKKFNDPKEELETFLSDVFKENVDSASDQSLQCRFPARFYWLNKKLNLLDNGFVTQAKCPEFQTWKEALDLTRVILVFPAAYLNNPASMFGHTLLRLDSKAGLKNPLLSYAASFGAMTGNDGGVAFAAKGLAAIILS